MKKLLLASVALAALGMGAPANAADMRARPLPPPVPVFSWTGCYVGFYGGYAIGQSEHELTRGVIENGVAVPAGSITGKFDMSGFVGGGTGGCQWQAGVWVVGFEADGGISNKDGQHFHQTPFDPNFVSQTTERWTSTARLRLGYAVDKWLLYVTGGAAWAGVEASTWFGGVQGTATISVPGAPFTFITAGVPAIHHKQSMLGYTVGVGMEYALTYGWSIKSEYLYADYGSKDFYGQPNNVTVVTPHRVNLYNHTWKWGLNYKIW